MIHFFIMIISRLLIFYFIVFQNIVSCSLLTTLMVAFTVALTYIVVVTTILSEKAPNSKTGTKEGFRK